MRLKRRERALALAFGSLGALAETGSTVVSQTLIGACLFMKVESNNIVFLALVVSN
jgi:hypothetical protein